MKDKGLLAVLLVPVFILLVPLIGMQVSSEWKWNLFDFVFAYGLMAGIGLAFRFFAKQARANPVAYRAGAGLALATAFLVIWVSAAVGIIGAENPGNLLYGVVLAIAFVGACLARFSAAGMARTLFVTAFAQLIVPVIAVLFWPTDFSPGFVPVFVLNLVFAMMFAGAALLFRHASQQRGRSASQPAAA